MEFFNQAGTFLMMMVGLMAILIVFAGYKAGWSKEKFKENWIKAEGDKKPMWLGMIKILAAPLLLGAILYAVNVEAEEYVHPSGIKWDTEVYSSEYKYFDGATVFVGLDYTQNPSPLCKDYGASDNITSNLGFTQSLVRNSQFNIGLKYTHHSCAISADKNGYDAIGLFVEWEIGRRK